MIILLKRSNKQRTLWPNLDQIHENVYSYTVLIRIHVRYACTSHDKCLQG